MRGFNGGQFAWNSFRLCLPSKIKKKGRVTIPAQLRIQAGFSNGKIILALGLATDESPDANDGYTPEQRRIIDGRLGESENDDKKGATWGIYRETP